MKRILLFLSMLLAAITAGAKDYTLSSPDGRTVVTVSSGNELRWSVTRDGVPVLMPSQLSLTLSDGTLYGGADRFKAKTFRVSETFATPLYKRAQVENNYNELRLSAKKYQVIFRAYNDGAAYRFETFSAVTVKDETAEFSFPEDATAWIPYVRKKATYEGQFFNSFENTYSVQHISAWEKDRIAFLPVTMTAPGGRKICITEADLLNYPGMYLGNEDGERRVHGVFARYPKAERQGGHNNLQWIVETREDYIYRGEGPEALPWRVLIIADSDKELAESDMVYRLAKPSEGDYSWVRPGKVAWDWWNDWNLYGVDFKTGVNTETYKYYIDFASSCGVGYVILDEGWAVNKKADLMRIVPEIDLPELARYAESKGVRLVLWAGYAAFEKDMDAVCRHYAEMGIAGWKVDFMDRDDQKVVDFYRRVAETAAKYHQFVDFHGAFKPTGLTRTYPNVLNFEGVHGLEQMKWSGKEVDQVTYDVTIPFTRLVAGPADYTQGAMRNATRDNYRPVNSEPMSQGTRCRQLAEYVVFDAPFTMLCDSPSNYLAEPECTAFIAGVPTVWDETRALGGKIGEYILMARRSGGCWYIAGMNAWEPMDMEIDLTPLGIGNASGTLFRDGANAHRAAKDYRKETVSISGGRTKVHLAPGGGFVLILGS